MAVDINLIKRLKDLTGVGLTDAKVALEAAGGNFDEALKTMRQKGLTKAEKRSEQEARSGIVGTYNHDNRIGVLVEVNCETAFVARNDIFLSLVKDLAMQIAASDPQYVSQNDVPDDLRQRITAELLAKAKMDSKPAKMISKIVEGQVNKYFSELCLMDQPFVKNPELKVDAYVKQHIARLGENIVIRRFARFALGELQ